MILWRCSTIPNHERNTKKIKEFFLFFFFNIQTLTCIERHLASSPDAFELSALGVAFLVYSPYKRWQLGTQHYQSVCSAFFQIFDAACSSWQLYAILQMRKNTRAL